MKLSKTLFLKGTKKDFYKIFIGLFREAYNLTAKEVDVLAAVLEIRSELLNKIPDISIVNKLLFSSENRERIAKMAGIADKKSLDINYISSLKRKGVITEVGKDKILNPNLAIYVKEDTYNLLISFNHDRS